MADVVACPLELPTSDSRIRHCVVSLSSRLEWSGVVGVIAPIVRVSLVG